MRRRKQKRSRVTAIVLLLVWSIGLGWGIAIAFGRGQGAIAVETPPNLLIGAIAQSEDTVSQLTTESDSSPTPSNPHPNPLPKGEGVRGDRGEGFSGTPFSISQHLAQANTNEIGTVDPILPRYQLGHELYLENCASCHVPLPPAVLPSETWRRLLLEPEQHYGQKLQPIIGPSLIIMWEYIRAYSRPEKEGKPLPYRMSQSSYFKALHPRVKFPQPVKPNGCVTCHPGAAEFNYRRLTPEWENSA
jgi:hypothetical protein